MCFNKCIHTVGIFCNNWRISHIQTKKCIYIFNYRITCTAYYFYKIACMYTLEYAYMCAQITVCVWWSEDSIWKLIFFLHVGPRDWTQACSLSSKCVYVLCHLIDPNMGHYSLKGNSSYFYGYDWVVTISLLLKNEALYNNKYQKDSLTWDMYHSTLLK